MAFLILLLYSGVNTPLVFLAFTVRYVRPWPPNHSGLAIAYLAGWRDALCYLCLVAVGGGGQVSGMLLPGNLNVATHLLGTPAQPQLEGVILAFEDVSEVTYRLDRCLTQLRMTGAIHQVRGLALGRFSQCQSPLGIPSFTVDEVLHDRLSNLNLPIVSDLPFGHNGPNAALPVGVPVHLDADTGKLEFVQL